MSVAVTSRFNGLRPLELGRLLQYGLAAASAGGALIHLAAARDHSSQAVEAALFIGAAVGQLVWAGLILRRVAWWLLGAGGLLSVVLITCWALSRTTGLPLLGGGVEPLGFKDGIAVLLEVAVVAGAGLLALLPAAGRTLPVPAGRLASHTALVSVIALTITAMAFAPAHSGGGHSGTELASEHHGEAGTEEVAGPHGDGNHVDAGGAHTSSEVPHGPMSAHAEAGHIAGPDGHGGAADHGGGPGATGLGYGGHGGSLQLAAGGAAADGHAGHAASGAEGQSPTVDHSGHGAAGPGDQAAEGDHSGHGASEPTEGGDTSGEDGGAEEEQDEPARKGLFGALIGHLDDLRQTRRPAGSSAGGPSEDATPTR